MPEAGMPKMGKSYRNWKPVEGLPAGLISWYAPGGRAVALVTYWLAMIGGERPSVRASWPGRRDSRSLFWPGGDFVLNIPGEKSLPMIRKLAAQGRVCLDVENDLGMIPAEGEVVRAPRLTIYPAQIECCSGRIDEEPVEPEVYGDVVLIHRGGISQPASSGLDLCMFNPFWLPSD
jgi:flavin reductase (DIM6/NTAB) family NADH-FMN oxidoreductase RutF